MPNLFKIIGESWFFWRKQQAAMHVTMWFLFIPMLGMSLLEATSERFEETIGVQPELQILFVLALVVLCLALLWGDVCTLSVGKRLLQAKSGRARTSFKTVRSQASSVYLPYLLTYILRLITALLWSLLLIIPGIVYAIRTAFFSIIVVCEGEAYRPALNRSMELVKGQFWPVFGTFIGLSALILFPAQLLDNIFQEIVKDAPMQIVFAASVASSVVNSVAMAVYLFSAIQAYGHFKPAGHVSN